MNLVANVHAFPHEKPKWDHRAGAEMFLWSLLEGWVSKGHSATVVVNRYPIDECFLWRSENMRSRVIRVVPQQENMEIFAKADVLLTHLDCTTATMDIANFWNKPLVHLVHNHASIYKFKCCRKSDLFILAANWLIEEYLDFMADFHWTVCYPYLDVEDYRTETPFEQRDCVLLSNLNSNKGGDLLGFLAEAMPDVRFVGIQGAYGDQCFEARSLPNVEIVPHTPDVRSLYERARIVIIPSKYESFGRVAAEAFASGIPVLATGTDGLVEAIGFGGQIVPLERRDLLNEWIFPIKRLYFDYSWWEFWSQKAKLRSLQLQAMMDQQLEATIHQIDAAARRYKQFSAHK